MMCEQMLKSEEEVTLIRNGAEIWTSVRRHLWTPSQKGSLKFRLQEPPSRQWRKRSVEVPG
ncbi:MAG: hypothetical protein Ct9H300mP16_14280 [Pseudomonadota bacterium]|nr:MAG: hypothetical protein Ct9H300mP16_14280 [Pseudomonadota bacterium]